MSADEEAVYSAASQDEKVILRNLLAKGVSVDSYKDDVSVYVYISLLCF